MDMRAAKPKGFHPTFAISLNLTFEPTPAKAIDSRNGMMLDFNTVLARIHALWNAGLVTDLNPDACAGYKSQQSDGPLEEAG